MARAPIQTVTNAAQLRLYWALSGNLGVNVIGVEHVGAVIFDQALANTLGAAIKAAFTAQVATHMATGTVLARVGIRSLSAPNLTEFRDTGAVVNGTGVGDALPPSVAQCLTLRTAESGKSARGRIYLSGWAESVNDVNGQQLAAAGTAGVAFINAINTALQGPGLRLSVVSRPAYEQIVSRETIIPGGTNFVQIISHSTAKPGRHLQAIAVESRGARWETMRSRVNGRGALPTALIPVASANLAEGIS